MIDDHNEEAKYVWARVSETLHHIYPTPTMEQKIAVALALSMVLSTMISEWPEKQIDKFLALMKKTALRKTQ